MARPKEFSFDDGKTFAPAVVPVDATGSPTGGGGDSSAIGTPSDPAYNGSGDGTVIAILKGLYAQNQEMMMDVHEIAQDTMVANALLNDIKTNTSGG